MFQVVKDTIGEGWLESLRQVVTFGRIERDEDVEIREILGLSIEISTPRTEDAIVSRHGDPGVVARTLAKFERGAVMPDRPFTYGERIYALEGVDQFGWLTERLTRKRETKSATICLLIPGSPDANLPCLTTLDAKIRDERLELQFFFRSQNIFGRQYANLLALARLQRELASHCAASLGTLRGFVASAHVYAFDLAQARRLLAGEPVTAEDHYYRYGPQSIRDG